MADPRAEALLRSLSGGADPGMMPEGEMPMEAEGPSTPEQAAAAAMQLLEPFMEDPRIANAASALQEVAAGPSEMPEDSMPMEEAGPAPQPGY